MSNVNQRTRCGHSMMLSQIFDQVFGHNGHIDGWQECSRAVVVFFYGLAAMRIAGRRVFGRWAAIDIIVSVIAGSNLSRALTGGADMGGTLAATTLIMVLHWLLCHGAARWIWLSKLVEGMPIELARDGTPNRGAMQRDAISHNDLAEALRQSGLQHMEESRLITLEPSGKITVLTTR